MQRIPVSEKDTVTSVRDESWQRMVNQDFSVRYHFGVTMLELLTMIAED